MCDLREGAGNGVFTCDSRRPKADSEEEGRKDLETRRLKDHAGGGARDYTGLRGLLKAIRFLGGSGVDYKEKIVRRAFRDCQAASDWDDSIHA
jgi:hypothetical protein